MSKTSGYTFPSGACDCHCHVFGPTARFPFADTRSYTPDEAPYEAVAALHRQLGIARAVVVQAACHGTDNAAMLAAIAHRPRTLRGIALLDLGRIDERQLRELHASGIRGIRFNYQGRAEDPPARSVRAAMEQIASFGWHALLHCRTGMLSTLTELIERAPLPIVIDHFGQIEAGNGTRDPDRRRLLQLAQREHVWIKISGADRIDMPPFTKATALAQRLLTQDPRRILWGSDFPHPNPRNRVTDAELTALIPLMMPDPTLQRRVLVENPTRLYDFS